MIFRCDIFFLDHLYCKLILLGVKESIVFIYQESFFLSIFVLVFLILFFLFSSEFAVFFSAIGNIRTNNLLPFLLDDEIFLGYPFPLSVSLLVFFFFLSLKRNL